MIPTSAIKLQRFVSGGHFKSPQKCYVNLLANIKAFVLSLFVHISRNLKSCLFCFILFIGPAC